MFIPDKCLNCNHTIVELENVHKGFCTFSYEPVCRCDCHPSHPKVGCVSAEVTCQNKQYTVF